jgi:hypothetical protein
VWLHSVVPPPIARSYAPDRPRLTVDKFCFLLRVSGLLQPGSSTVRRTDVHEIHCQKTGCVLPARSTHRLAPLQTLTSLVQKFSCLFHPETSWLAGGGSHSLHPSSPMEGWPATAQQSDASFLGSPDAHSQHARGLTLITARRAQRPTSECHGPRPIIREITSTEGMGRNHSFGPRSLRRRSGRFQMHECAEEQEPDHRQGNPGPCWRKHSETRRNRRASGPGTDGI